MGPFGTQSWNINKLQQAIGQLSPESLKQGRAPGINNLPDGVCQSFTNSSDLLQLTFIGQLTDILCKPHYIPGGIVISTDTITVSTTELQQIRQFPQDSS